MLFFVVVFFCFLFFFYLQAKMFIFNEDQINNGSGCDWMFKGCGCT